ncbi:MAG: hypothetical protein KIB43_10155 [Clostridium baratii]|uniref:hypothetical protein n=1 Tax=Clostridium baratii TaxID=1561 RepID=UPI0006C6EA79|nr:hypothetical protein [Clostridium baratii]MBS6007310.1 hypothetical protein [Clostridium baratii]CUP45309.1 Uncharacterised protein [Clostridium baratii]
MNFDINELVKEIINQNEYMDNNKKKNLLEKVKYNGVTSIEAYKIIDGILNYGVALEREKLKDLPDVDCRKLNTALFLILKYYKNMDKETFFDSLELMTNINIDSIDGGLIEKDIDAPITAIIDILEDYVFGSNPDDKGVVLSKDEIELYKVNINYGVNRIREQNRDFLDIY